jgi:hypothetical protein
MNMTTGFRNYRITFNASSQETLHQKSPLSLYAYKSIAQATATIPTSKPFIPSFPAAPINALGVGVDPPVAVAVAVPFPCTNTKLAQVNLVVLLV